MRRSLQFAVAGVFLALAQVAVAPAAGPTLPLARGDGGFAVVRFAERITGQSLADVLASGVRLVDYLPERSYIVWGTRAQVRAAGTRGAVRSVEPYGLELKLNPDSDRATYLEINAATQALEGLLSRLRTLGPVDAAYAARPDRFVTTIRMPVAPGAARAIAADPAVLSVNPAAPFATLEDEATDQILAGNLASGRPVTGYRTWLASKGLSGAGVRVAIVDTGISQLHPDFLRADGSSRIVAVANYSLQPAGHPLDTGGHGTHVAGIVAGNPHTPAMTDTAGFEWGLGVAPAADLVLVNGIDTTASFPPPGGLSSFSRDALANGANLWNASWHTGEGERTGYTASTQTMDLVVRDGDFLAPGAQPFLPVFSAGNAGSSGPTVPHEAKNIIAVGATASGRGTGGLLGGSNEFVEAFSSKGLTRDNRIFPTVVAPGGSVVSARGPESTLGCTPPAGGAPLYYTCSGTSMAAPHATGAATLIHESWKASHAGAIPSPAMVKAILVNTADDLIGNSPIPNRSEGWGRINLTNVFDGTATVYDDQATTFDDPGVVNERLITVADTSKPLRITVAWSDAAGAVCSGPVAGCNSPRLVNDLDLVVEHLDGAGIVDATWLGNVFSGGQSISGGLPDIRNNLENVYLNSPASGTYRIRVAATAVNGDGVPSVGDANDQDFVLVARNALPV